jgi:hypothetical protein
VLAVARVVLVCLALGPAVGHAEAGRSGFLPSREPPGAARQARLERLARALGLTVGGAPRFALGAMVERAETLAASGRLDEAAALVDVALDEGTRAPLEVGDPPALVRAAIVRATIGLARGEQERADRLLALVLRYDPTFHLLPREESPRMRAAVERALRRQGATAALERADLGERCAEQTLLVARRLDGSHVEYARYAGCVEVARVRAGDDEPEAALVTALGGPAVMATAPVAEALAPRPPAAGDARRERRPVWRTGWFWGVTIGAVALVAAGVGVGVWAATRNQGTSDTSWHVTPRF